MSEEKQSVFRAPLSPRSFIHVIIVGECGPNELATLVKYIDIWRAVADVTRTP